MESVAADLSKYKAFAEKKREVLEQGKKEVGKLATAYLLISQSFLFRWKCRPSEVGGCCW